MVEFQWEAVVVGGEIVGTVAAAVWLLYRRGTRHEHLLLEGTGRAPASAGSWGDGAPLVEPRACWTLRGLFRFRATMAAFFCFVQCCDIVRTRGRCLVFYTSWNFIAQGGYFAYAAAQTLQLLKAQAGDAAQAYASLLDDGSSGPFRRSPYSVGRRRGWLRAELVLDVVLATSILIATVVWTILYPYAVRVHESARLLNWVSYCQHGVNVVLLQIEFLATHHRVSVDALPLVLLWPSLYTIFTWLLHGTVARGFWPYPFLELNTPWAPVWYLGLLLAHLAAFVLVLALSHLKKPLQPAATPADFSPS